MAVDLVAEMTVINPFDFFLQDEAIEYPFRYEDAVRTELLPYLETLPRGPRLKEFLAGIPRKSKKTVDFLVDLNQYVHDAVKYVIRMEPGVQTCEETLTLRSGSCRDSAWLLVQVLRNLGLAARFVSGYLIQLKPDMKPLDGPPGPAADFTDLHAWAEVYLPGAGWVGLDPTSGLLAGEGHLPLAATPDPDSAAPITGCVEPCEIEFYVQMSVTRVADAPRVTKPYTEEQWAAVEQLGHKVDARLDALRRPADHGRRADLRVDRRHGRPRVEHDRRQSAKAAPGRHAAAAPVALLRPRRAAALRPRQVVSRRVASPLGLGLLLAQGRRADLAQAGTDRRRRPRPPRRRRHGPGLHHRTWPNGCDVRRDHVVPGYEDTWYYLWKERRLPANVDPLKSNLENEEERKRLARIFEHGLSQVVGYALPIRPIYSDGVIHALGKRPLVLRQENMFLLPGDSPMGLRLPLGQPALVRQRRQQPLAGARSAGAARPAAFARLGLANRNGYGRPAGHGPLSPTYAPDESRRHAAGALDAPGGARSSKCRALRRRRRPGSSAIRRALPCAKPPSRVAETLIAEPTSQTIRTALCVEAREGRMHVFMPPVARLEDYLNLVAAIEDTAEELAMPVMIEGYTPPWDYRLQHFKVTPDPGVIEVNLQPSANWEELVDNTTTLYDEARQSRLGTEKFMLDGRHTGTGGGNHIVLGGAKPIDSPFLRRPDLLRSLVAYWNNRPSLSYLFSGLFVGPTSQAPRVDEARHESLYELETAFAQLPRRRQCPPWMVDRAVPQSAGRPDGQHAPRRVLHRQAVFARLGHRPLGAGRVPQLRNAAARADEPDAAVAGAGAGRPFLGSALSAAAGPLGHVAARPLHAAALHRAGFPRSARRAARVGHGLPAGVVRAALRVPLPLAGRGDLRRRQARTAAGHRAVARVGRRDRSPTATARYVDSSVERLEVKVRGMTGRAARRRLQRPPRAAASHGHAGRVCRRRALPGLAAAELPAPHDRRSYAAGLRSLRSLVEPLDRRLHVARLPSGRRELRDFPGQRPGCREPPRRAIPGHGPHGRTGAAAPARAQSRLSDDARSAPTGGNHRTGADRDLTGISAWELPPPTDS